MKKVRILLLSKDDFVIDVFKEALGSDDFIIYLTQDPGKVVESAIKKKVDMFFYEADIMEDDCFELCGYLNDIIETSDIVKIMILMEINMEIFKKAKKVGVHDFLLRPLYSGELRIKIENILHARDEFAETLRENQDIAASHVGFSVEHYIGQPLTAILGAVEVLKMIRSGGKEIEESEMMEVYDIIITASNELNSTIKKFGNLKTYKTNLKIGNKKIVEIEDLDKEEDESGELIMF